MKVSLACPLQTLQINAQPIPPSPVSRTSAPSPVPPQKEDWFGSGFRSLPGITQAWRPQARNVGISRCAWLVLILLLLAYVLGPMPSILSLICPWPSLADFAVVSQRGVFTLTVPCSGTAQPLLCGICFSLSCTLAWNRAWATFSVLCTGPRSRLCMVDCTRVGLGGSGG